MHIYPTQFHPILLTKIGLCLVQPIQDRMCLLITIPCYKRTPFDSVYQETIVGLFVFVTAPTFGNELPTYPGDDQVTRSSRVPTSE